MKRTVAIKHDLVLKPHCGRLRTVAGRVESANAEAEVVENSTPIALLNHCSNAATRAVAVSHSRHAELESQRGKAMLSRRTVLGSAASTLISLNSLVAQSQSRSSKRAARFEPDVELKLVAEQSEAAIWGGRKTRVMQFRGEVLAGRETAMRDSGSFLGPTLDLLRGERVRIRFENHLNEPTIVHWHGMIVPEAADGHPRLAVKPGANYTYEFTVENRAGTYWYHPHPHGRTGFQVYHGLGGALIVRDPEEDSIELPAGDNEHVLVIQDRRADENNQLQYVSHMMDRMSGVLGDRVLINGQPNFSPTVSRGPSRLRLLNLSNARLYKLAWSDGSPMHVIGTDGGLLSGEEGPRKVPFVVLGPAERIELWEDFSTRSGGSEATLISQEFSLPMGMGMGPGRRMMMRPGMGPGRGRGPGMGMMGMMSGPGQKLTIAKFRVADEEASKGTLPTLPGRKPQLPRASKQVLTKLGFRMMRGFLNGKQWDMRNMSSTDRNEILKRNEPVIWTFDNNSEPGMLMPHPMHLHGVQFRVLERKGTGAGELAKGVIDAGDKDTVMVFAGDVVKIQVTPTVEGLFVYHCHNLEHEDAGMMRNFRVRA